MPNTQVSIIKPPTTPVPLNTPKTVVEISLSDADGSVGIYQISLLPSRGTLSLGSTEGITHLPDSINGTVDNIINPTPRRGRRKDASTS